jgi:hypothetical protein
MFALLATAQVKTYMDGQSEVTLHHYIAPTTHALGSYEAAQKAANKVMGTYVSLIYPLVLYTILSSQSASRLPGNKRCGEYGEVGGMMRCWCYQCCS